MVKFKFTEAQTEDYDKWLSFYPDRNRHSPFTLKLEGYGYFDPRPQLVFNLTSVLALILPFLSLWLLPLSIFFLFYGWGQTYIRIPYDTGKGDECESPQYGLNTYTHGSDVVDELWVYWGKSRKHLGLPWAFKWYRTSILLKDGTWEHEYKGQKKDFYKSDWDSKKFVEQHPYKYVLKSGEVQERIATVTIEEREWRRNSLMFTALFNNIRRTIAVEFDQEVGERTGSWKGGTVGCGYEILPWEKPVEALRRMEAERKFN